MAKKKSDASTIAILKPDKRNARKHNPRNIGMIADSMQEVGAARSIVIDEDDNILAGNGAVEAAAQAGITKLHVVDADGETIVAVRRRGLTKEQKIRLSVADNRTAELAEWDVEILSDFSEEGMLAGMFSESELKSVLFSPDDVDDFDPNREVPGTEGLSRITLMLPTDRLGEFQPKLEEWCKKHSYVKVIRYGE